MTLKSTVLEPPATPEAARKLHPRRRQGRMPSDGCPGESENETANGPGTGCRLEDEALRRARARRDGARLPRALEVARPGVGAALPGRRCRRRDRSSARRSRGRRRSSPLLLRTRRRRGRCGCCAARTPRRGECRRSRSRAPRRGRSSRCSSARRGRARRRARDRAADARRARRPRAEARAVGREEERATRPRRPASPSRCPKPSRRAGRRACPG